MQKSCWHKHVEIYNTWAFETIQITSNIFILIFILIFFPSDPFQACFHLFLYLYAKCCSNNSVYIHSRPLKRFCITCLLSSPLLSTLNHNIPLRMGKESVIKTQVFFFIKWRLCNKLSWRTVFAGVFQTTQSKTKALLFFEPESDCVASLIRNRT